MFRMAKMGGHISREALIVMIEKLRAMSSHGEAERKRQNERLRRTALLDL
jgi:hypothetical protein